MNQLIPHLSPRAARALCFLSLAIAAALGSGCATGRVALSPEKRDTIQSTRSVIGLQNDEIRGEINKSKISNATGGGLVPILIDAAVDHSRTKKSEEAIVPVRRVLADFRPGDQLANRLSADLRRLTWLKTNVVESTLLEEKSFFPALMETTRESHLLLLETSHALTPDFAEVKVTVKATVHPVSDGRSWKAIYLNEFAYQKRLPGLEGKVDRHYAAERWAADDGDLLRAYLAEGLNEIAAMLVHDISDPSSPKFDRASAIRLNDLHGVVVQESIDRVWLRVRDGSLHSLSR